MLAQAAIVLAALLAAAPRSAATSVSFASRDGGTIVADQYGAGSRAVVLAHGGRYDKESWAPQARALAAAGFRVLAIDFRGYGRSSGPGQRTEHAPFDLDVLAATAYARAHGATSVAVVGASLGASAAGDASSEDRAHSIDRVVLLSESPSRPAARIRVPVLVIVSRDDASADGPRLPRIERWYRGVRAPKRLVVLPGSSHGQQLFRTAQSGRVISTIIGFLRAGS